MTGGVRDAARGILEDGDIDRFNFHYQSLSPAESPDAQIGKLVL
jgi:hypothetical protein